MAATPHLSLPLLDSAQAQKHVTMNEALSRIDALTTLGVSSRTVADPPSSPSEGDRYIIPATAGGAWVGRTDQIAIFLNGGWSFATPALGWKAVIADEAAQVVFDGLAWRGDAVSILTAGATTAARIVVFDHVISAGASSDTLVAIPDRAIVLGVTARVIAAIAGPTSWRLGVAGAEDRYGSSLGVGLNSEAHGVTSNPLAYYGVTPLRLTADGGVFSSGTVRFALHILALTPPALA